MKTVAKKFSQSLHLSHSNPQIYTLVMAQLLTYPPTDTSSNTCTHLNSRQVYITVGLVGSREIAACVRPRSSRDDGGVVVALLYHVLDAACLESCSQELRSLVARGRQQFHPPLCLFHSSCSVAAMPVFPSAKSVAARWMLPPQDLSVLPNLWNLCSYWKWVVAC